MVQEETNEENEKEVESKFTLEVVLPNVSQIYTRTLYCPNLGIKVKIIKEALFSFSMSKIRNEGLYGMFVLSACHTMFGGSRLFDHGASCKGHDSNNNQRQALTFTSLPPPHDRKNFGFKFISSSARFIVEHSKCRSQRVGFHVMGLPFNLAQINGK